MLRTERIIYLSFTGKNKLYLIAIHVTYVEDDMLAIIAFVKCKGDITRARISSHKKRDQNGVKI